MTDIVSSRSEVVFNSTSAEYLCVVRNLHDLLNLAALSLAPVVQTTNKCRVDPSNKSELLQIVKLSEYSLD